MRRARTTIRVQWGDADPAGIVYYPNYFHWFAVGTMALLAAWRVSFAAMFRRQSAGLPVIEAHARFLAAVSFEEELEVETIVAEVRTRAFRLEHTVWRGVQRVAEGYEVRGWQHIDRDRPHEVTLLPIPDDLAAWLSGEGEIGASSSPDPASPES
ncbi:MAG TPA: thioesterase family protein [Chloroflexota bacterium]